MSSTEAEFYAATEAGNSILYIRSILEDLGLEQRQATVLHMDNNRAFNIDNQRQPTQFARHIDIENFAIQNWIETDLILLRTISSSANYSDALTKPMGRILNHYHMNYILGSPTHLYRRLIRYTEL